MTFNRVPWPGPAARRLGPHVESGSGVAVTGVPESEDQQVPGHQPSASLPLAAPRRRRRRPESSPVAGGDCGAGDSVVDRLLGVGDQLDADRQHQVRTVMVVVMESVMSASIPSGWHPASPISAHQPLCSVMPPFGDLPGPAHQVDQGTSPTHRSVPDRRSGSRRGSACGGPGDAELALTTGQVGRPRRRSARSGRSLSRSVGAQRPTGMPRSTDRDGQRRTLAVDHTGDGSRDGGGGTDGSRSPGRWRR